MLIVLRGRAAPRRTRTTADRAGTEPSPPPSRPLPSPTTRCSGCRATALRAPRERRAARPQALGRALHRGARRSRRRARAARQGAGRARSARAQDARAGRWRRRARSRPPRTRRSATSCARRSASHREEVGRAERRLRELEVEASLAGVPAEWRRARARGRRRRDASATALRAADRLDPARRARQERERGRGERGREREVAGITDRLGDPPGMRSRAACPPRRRAASAPRTAPPRARARRSASGTTTNAAPTAPLVTASISDAAYTPMRPLSGHAAAAA